MGFAPRRLLLAGFTLLAANLGAPANLHASPLGGVEVAGRIEGGAPPAVHAPRPAHVPRRSVLQHAAPDGPRLRVVGRVATGVEPKSVKVSPDGRRVYVANFGMLDRQNISVFDADTLAPVGQVDFPGNAVELEFSRDGRTLYASNFRRAMVEVIDVATLTLRSEIRVGSNPKTLALSPDGARLYCANWSDGTLSIIGVAEGRELRRVRAGRHPRGVVVMPDGSVLVASFYDDVVRVLTPDGDRVARFDTCRLPRHLALSPDASRVWVTCTLGSIGAYDLRDHRRHVFALTGDNPRTLDVGWGGRFVATANFGSSDVSLLDVSRMRRQTTSIEGADKLVGLAFAPGDAGRLYVTSWDTSELVALEIAADE